VGFCSTQTLHGLFFWAICETSISAFLNQSIKENKLLRIIFHDITLIQAFLKVCARIFDICLPLSIQSSLDLLKELV